MCSRVVKATADTERGGTQAPVQSELAALQHKMSRSSRATGGDPGGDQSARGHALFPSHVPPK